MGMFCLCLIKRYWSKNVCKIHPMSTFVKLLKVYIAKHFDLPIEDLIWSSRYKLFCFLSIIFHYARIVFLIWMSLICKYDERNRAKKKSFYNTLNSIRRVQWPPFRSGETNSIKLQINTRAKFDPSDSKCLLLCYTFDRLETVRWIGHNSHICAY